MIENYKGWDITLTWQDDCKSKIDSNDKVPFYKNKKWVGVNIDGNTIYGSSLKEIRHIIDYPKLNIH